MGTTELNPPQTAPQHFSYVTMKLILVLSLIWGFLNFIEASSIGATTWDPWSPCQEDSECPDDLMCNTWQGRCSECMENEDCPPCLEDDCPFQGEGVCVYGDHCCTPEYC